MLDQAIFKSRNKVYTFQHILNFFEFQNRIGVLLKGLRNKLACQEFAEEEGFQVDDEQLQAASDSFRYERNIITVAETEKWLKERYLTLEDFSDYLIRDYWYRRFSTGMDHLIHEYPLSKEVIEQSLWPETVLGGRFADLILPVTHRIAAMAENSNISLPAETIDEEHKSFFRRMGLSSDGLEPWLDQMNWPRDWFEELIHMEAHYKYISNKTLIPERITRELNSQYLPLTRIEIDAACFPSANTAQEAFLCISKDGESLEVVSERAHGKRISSKFFLRDLPEGLQQYFFSASEREVLKPIEQDGKFWIFRVCRKTPPDLKDVEVRSFVEERVFASFLRTLMEKHIYWIVSIV